MGRFYYSQDNAVVTALRRQLGLCFYCKQELPPGQATRDHWIPLCVWKRLDAVEHDNLNQEDWFPEHNTVAACAKCNNSKGDIVPEPALTWLRHNTRLTFDDIVY